MSERESTAERINEVAAKLTAAVGQRGWDLEKGGTALLVPDGFTLERLEPIEPRLARVQQLVRLADVASFVDYVNTFDNKATRLFADGTHRTVTALFDYHEPGPEGEHTLADAVPGRLAHRAIYEAPFSDEWRRWRALHRQPVDQTTFLEFLEENAQDVVRPAAADVLEFVANFRSVRSSKMARSIRLHDGSVNLTFSDEAGTEASVASPSEMMIAVPIFEGGERVEVRVFLRHRSREGGLHFLPVIHRIEFLERELFDEAVARIETETDNVAWSGRLGV